MKKLICLCFCCVLLFLAMAQPLSAANEIETDRLCSLTLQYGSNGINFANTQVKIFRVAEYYANTSYALTEDFAEYPVNIYNLTSSQLQKDAAQTLLSYAKADGITPAATITTDHSGKAVFENLKVGLYLVSDVDAEDSGINYRFDTFLIFLPRLGQNGEQEYTVQAKPKCSIFSPVTKYTVTKLWQDNGAESSRPKSVEVNIFENQKLSQTVSLNAENNWSYSWESSDINSKWSVAEKNVPNGYSVTITEKDSDFTLVNTAADKPSATPPKTGDTSPLGLYVSLMCISGVMLILLSIWRKRAQL